MYPANVCSLKLSDKHFPRSICRQTHTHTDTQTHTHTHTRTHTNRESERKIGSSPKRLKVFGQAAESFLCKVKCVIYVIPGSEVWFVIELP